MTRGAGFSTIATVTIRDHVEAQRRKVGLTNWLITALMVVTAVLAIRSRRPGDNLLTLHYYLWGLPAVMVAIVVMTNARRGLKCPTCKSPLERQPIFVPKGAASEHCPMCSADFSQPMPPKSIADYLDKRRTVIGNVNLVVSIALIPGLIALACLGVYRGDGYNWTLFWWLLIAVVVCIAAMIWIARARCPSCEANLHRLIVGKGAEQPLVNCPHCGVRFNQPMPGKAI
jgi:hypothetical protein